MANKKMKNVKFDDGYSLSTEEVIRRGREKEMKKNSKFSMVKNNKLVGKNSFISKFKSLLLKGYLFLMIPVCLFIIGREFAHCFSNYLLSL